MNINLDFWILRLCDSTRMSNDHPFAEDKKVEYVRIPSNLTYNQIFKTIFLIVYLYDNEFEDGEMFVKEITAKQIAYIFKYIFNYEILDKKTLSIEDESDNNRIKNLVLSYINNEAEINIPYDKRKSSLNGIENIEEILDKNKYFYFRIAENRPYTCYNDENEPLVFRDTNKIKEAIKYVIDNHIENEINNISQKKLKKDIVCLKKTKNGEKFYFAMNKGEGSDFIIKLLYISILYENKYRKKSCEKGIRKYPLYRPIDGDNKIKLEEMVYLINKIYGYKLLSEKEIELLNKGANKRYYNGIHHEVYHCSLVSTKSCYWHLCNKEEKYYVRPNVSRIILERQIEIAPENKKEYFIEKLRQIEESEDPECLDFSILSQDYE